MSRKGENIYKRKDGRWEARYIKGRSETGKAIYGYVYGRTYKEAKSKRERVLRSLDQVKAQSISHIADDCTFKEIADKWLLSVAPQVKTSTYNKYKNLIVSYIIPELGGIEYADITVECLRTCCNHLLEAGGKNQSGLSRKTVSDVLSLIRRILAYANSNGYKTICFGNEFSIRQEAKEMNILDREEQQLLCSYLLKHPTERNIAIIFCLFTGLRIGELCALKWDDISLSNGTVYIHQIIQRIQIENDPVKKTKVVITTPKSKCSIRTIPIPDTIVSLLESSDIKHYGYLATGNNAKYLEPRTMQIYFQKVLECASIRSVNFHALRHTFATRCVEVGFDIKSLSEILGHASVTITMNRYVHPSLELKRQNMQKLSDLFAVNH